MTGHRQGVILLHGLARTCLSMRSTASYLRQLGYKVLNLDYPSRRFPIERLAQDVLPPALATIRKQDVDTVHFVTHSMGGIVLRSFLSVNGIFPELGRVVMLSPPNQGSELVDLLRSFFWFRRFFGPAGQQLGTDPCSLPNQLGPARFVLGIITGDRPFKGFGYFFSEPSDGKVTVSRAKLTGMTDFLVVPYGHSMIMSHRPVHEQIGYFLKNGRFRRNR
ncbi:MAG: alpha/beta fold hydrolase [Desulfobulbus sp.]|nr:alpha/beta fold hydrolase [Desulfobulbus sp.]